MTRESPRRRPRDRTNDDKRPRSYNSNKKPRAEALSSHTSSQALSADTLAKLNLLNEKALRKEELRAKTARIRPRDLIDEKLLATERSIKGYKRRRKRRVVSGSLLEEGEGRRLQRIRSENLSDEDPSLRKQKKRICMS
jgi:glucan 1,3-beta-glucosidase